MNIVAVGAAMAEPAAVGRVSLVIGQASRISLAGEVLPVMKGTQIQMGDLIETGEGGHAHIRFADGALVSVRPASRLRIEDYQYNPADLTASRVRFTLDKGTTRAISGAAAEGAKERFRLNTPLVAIGVRGTDFVVRTFTDQTLATVNQGAIVMAPFDQNCLRDSLGPCSSMSARLLSADMGNVLAEFHTGAAQPVIKPLTSVVVSNTIRPTDGLAVPASAGARQEDVTAPQVQAARTQEILAESAGSSISTPPPVVVVPPSPQPPPALAWGRWADIGRAGDFSLPRSEASNGRSITVANSQYLLYRSNVGSAVIPSSLGQVSFALDQSYAQVTAAGVVLPAQVLGGSLSINFAQRQFATSLSLTSLPTGAQTLNAAGFVRDDGIFSANSGAQSVAGAAALSGNSAGYLFERATANGQLSGITLWGR